MRKLHLGLRKSKWLVLAILLVAVLIALVPQPATAQVESRVSQLEFELRQVRSQLSQIEARLSQPGQTAPIPVRPATPPRTATNPSLETQFDNLATLAIELKQQVRALETRVARLEESGNTRFGR
ncbi:MAG TPA: hypothetical protein V6D07_06995 [Trichocoleus sp.]